MPHAGAVISQTTVMLHANYPVPLQLKIREKDKKLEKNYILMRLSAEKQVMEFCLFLIKEPE